MEKQKSDKLAIALQMIKSGAYQPTATPPGAPPGLMQRMGQNLTGPQLGGQNMDIMGQNFQMQTPESRMANLKAQLAQIQSMNQGGDQQGGSPMMSDASSGLPKSLPNYQVSPGDIDMSSGTVSPKVSMTSPLQQVEYQDKLMEMNKKQEEARAQSKMQEDLSKPPEDIKIDMKKRSPGLYNLGEKIARGDMTLNELPKFGGKSGNIKTNLMEYLSSAYPGMDEQKIAARRKTKMDYTPGGSIGKQATIAGTMIQHMYELKKTIPELGDTGFKPFNQAKQTASRVFGPGSSALKKYDTIKNAISGEWDKYLRAGGSAEAGIDRILKSMDEADTPEAQNAALDEMANLMSGRMGQYVDEWHASFDQPGDPKVPSYVMSTRTRFALNKMGLDDVIKSVENPEGTAKVDEQKDKKSSLYSVGQTIKVGNKNYKVIGGDPNDPDIEEVK